jgi:glycosyltransferase involved in cell wall biosynthesis
MLMAERGWEVTFLSAPISGNRLELPRHPRIAVRAIHARPSHVMGKASYASYIAAATGLALRCRPEIVYASDPLGAGPGLLAARLARARLVYHEHDSPGPGSLRAWLARLRTAAARRAELVVFPNEARACIAQAELGYPPDRQRIVWNLPRRAELPPLAPAADGPLMLYYHGGISPERLPEALVEAMWKLGGRLRLRIIGRETPGARGYITWLLDRGVMPDGTKLVKYFGQIPQRHDVLVEAARAQIGLALMPCHGNDVNLDHMTGASNKPFDYMAAGLALLVSERADWRDMFVTPAYARPCDPSDPASVAAALSWFLDHPAERRAMAARGRAKIETEWNYDSAFEPVISALVHG